jgi:hypothetical protein
MKSFLLPPIFSLLHLKRYGGLTKLQRDPQSFNCIKFDLFVFQFHQLTFALIKFDTHSFNSYLFCF